MVTGCLPVDCQYDINRNSSGSLCPLRPPPPCDCIDWGKKDPVAKHAAMCSFQRTSLYTKESQTINLLALFTWVWLLLPSWCIRGQKGVEGGASCLFLLIAAAAGRVSYSIAQVVAGVQLSGFLGSKLMSMCGVTQRNPIMLQSYVSLFSLIYMNQIYCFCCLPCL